uniref:Alternative protein CFP n=1 Tax=Homo sapiens TaxID=9606 RepID=L0R836_HUMAN|nr:alternative protein CFP [Homo sapiens]
MGSALERWHLGPWSGSSRPVRTSSAVLRWAAGLAGGPGSLALSPAPKGPGPAGEPVITLLPSVGATAQDRHRNQRPVTPSRSAPHTGPGPPGAPGPPAQPPATVDPTNLRRHEAASVLHLSPPRNLLGSPARG